MRFRSFFLWCTVLSTLNTGCKKKPPAEGPSQPVAVSAPTQVPVATTPDLEAADLASAHWNGFFTKCGGTWFTQIFYGPGRGDLHGYQSMTEYQGLNWITNGYALSDADRLNGIQWNGYSEVHAIAARTQPRNGGWGQWQAYGGASYEQVVVRRLLLTKQNGQWRSNEDGVGRGDEMPLSCADQQRFSDPQQQLIAAAAEAASVAEDQRKTADEALVKTGQLLGGFQGLNGIDGTLIYDLVVPTDKKFPDGLESYFYDGQSQNMTPTDSKIQVKVGGYMKSMDITTAQIVVTVSYPGKEKYDGGTGNPWDPSGGQVALCKEVLNRGLSHTGVALVKGGLKVRMAYPLEYCRGT